MSLPVAILAGGLATRLQPLTETVPKALLEVCGRPFVIHQMELLKSAGITDVVLCLGHLGERVEAVLNAETSLGLRLTYVYDGPRLLGTGGALRNALPFLGEAFFVLYGDSYLECDYRAVEESFRRSGKSGLMTAFRNDDRWDRSNILYCDGAIVAYGKSLRLPGMHHIDYGLGVLSRRALERHPANAVLDLASVYQDLLVRGELAAFEVVNRFYEIGSIEGLAETRQHICGSHRPLHTSEEPTA